MLDRKVPYRKFGIKFLKKLIFLKNFHKNRNFRGKKKIHDNDIFKKTS